MSFVKLGDMETLIESVNELVEAQKVANKIAFYSLYHEQRGHVPGDTLVILKKAVEES